MLLRVVLVFFAVFTASGLDSIDIVEPIVRNAPASLDDNGYFGFSAVLHRTSPSSPGNFDDYLISSRIIVSAPNGSADGAMVENTGVLYSCPVVQGECEPLIGDSGGAGALLYDTTANERNGANNDDIEDKHKQFLGVAMDSSDNMFVVCAHRYFYSPGSSRYPRGRCFYTTNRDLRDFQEYAPCEGRSTGTGSFGQCQAGSSVVLADENTNTGSTVVPIIVGAPGSRQWQGAVFRRATSGSTTLTGSGESTANYAWQGYSMTRGHFLSTTREDLAVSVPRLNNYFGQVNIIMNNNGLDFDGQTLKGTTQMGEYYGFSLAAVDLNGDGLDELLVGAPMYSPTGSPEAGQVYVYRNIQGTLQAFRQITAPVNNEYARFGHAITNLGDVNGDGLEDVAISAPFGTGSGKVYIYYGSVADTISQTVQQIIIGSVITEALSGVSTPRGFGYSVTSSLDVDGNGINDLLIGAYASQQVFLLRSRAVANVPITLSTSPNIINLDTSECTLNAVNYACFQVTACAMFPQGESFTDSTELEFLFVVDRRNNELGLQQRAFFNNSGMLTNQTVSRSFNRGQEICVMETIYIMSGISDRFNGFPVEVAMTGPQFTPSALNGNPVPSSLLLFPVVSVSGQTETQVETFKDCDGQTCVPDLQLQFIEIIYESSSGEAPTNFTAGQVTNFEISMTLNNAGDDAFLTTISFAIPTAQFEFIRIEPRELLITCSSEVGNEETVLTCPIANPLTDNQMRGIRVRLRPTSGLRPSEGPFQFTFTASSINNENGTLQNNVIIVSINVTESADVYLDNAVADPEQLSYSTNVTVGNITLPEDLGPPVTVSYVVRNAGPSTVPETRLRIFWPLRELDNELYYLYPSQIQRSVSTTVDCEEDQYINQLGLTIQTASEGDEEDDGSFGNEGRRRRRRRSMSPLRRKKRSIRKRQSEQEMVDDIVDISINCRSNPELCVEIVCTIRQLVGGNSVQVDVVSHLDERYFVSRVDRFTFVPYANVSIVSAGIGQPVGHLSDETEVQIRVVTADPPPRTGGSGVEPWVIIVPIVLGILFFIVLGVILYFVGFFRRKNKQKKEEIQAQFLENQQGGDTFDDVPPGDKA